MVSEVRNVLILSLRLDCLLISLGIQYRLMGEELT